MQLTTLIRLRRLTELYSKKKLNKLNPPAKSFVTEWGYSKKIDNFHQMICFIFWKNILCKTHTKTPSWEFRFKEMKILPRCSIPQQKWNLFCKYFNLLILEFSRRILFEALKVVFRSSNDPEKLRRWNFETAARGTFLCTADDNFWSFVPFFFWISVLLRKFSSPLTFLFSQSIFLQTFIFSLSFTTWNDTIFRKSDDFTAQVIRPFAERLIFS